MEDIQEAIDQLRKQHRKAGHHCYAYRLGLDKNNYRANDDGEPSGTAGRPILGQIDSAGLTDVLVVVVRYFGGIKLGASGLGTAYKTAARQALDTAHVIEKEIQQSVQIKTDHNTVGILMTNAKKLGWTIVKADYDPLPVVTLDGPKTNFDTRLIELKAKVLSVSVEQAINTPTPSVFHILQSEKNADQ